LVCSNDGHGNHTAQVLLLDEDSPAKVLYSEKIVAASKPNASVTSEHPILLALNLFFFPCFLCFILECTCSILHHTTDLDMDQIVRDVGLFLGFSLGSDPKLTAMQYLTHKFLLWSL
jgi:hypothetical protein